MSAWVQYAGKVVVFYFVLSLAHLLHHLVVLTWILSNKTRNTSCGNWQFMYEGSFAQGLDYGNSQLWILSKFFSYPKSLFNDVLFIFKCFTGSFSSINSTLMSWLSRISFAFCDTFSISGNKQFVALLHQSMLHFRK